MAKSSHFASIAKIAYLDNAHKPFRKLGYNEAHLIDIDGAQAHIAANNESIVIAFRGTEPSEWNDLKADMYAFKDFYGYHKGFSGEFNKLHIAILDRLKRLNDKHETTRDLYITGHSLGGAMAVIAGYYFPEAKCIYTFGAPRSVSWSKAKKLIPPHIRVVNNNDVVPKVPMSFLGFGHTGTLNYMNYHGKFRYMTRWQRFKDGWRGRRQALKKRVSFDGFYDHSVNQYCNLLKADEE